MNVLGKLNDYGFRSEFKTSLLCLLFVVPAFNAQAIDVAVVERAGGGLGGGAAVVAQLNDDTYFDFTATLVDPAGVDSAAELANYDVVVLGGAGSGNDPIWSTAMANALKVFVEGGGGVLMTGWGHWNSLTGGPANAAAAVILDTFVPGDIDTPYSFSCCRLDTTIVLTDLSHPITQDLPASFSYGADGFLEYNRHPLQPGDVSLGIPANPTYGSGHALIYRENIGAGNGRSVYLGALHMAAVSDHPSIQSGLRSGPGDQLLKQALAWLAPPPADTDGDGVLDYDDFCPDTSIPERVPTVRLNPNHWALIDDDSTFDTVVKGKDKGANRSYWIEDTAGCSCEQIIEAQGLGGGHSKHGCSISAMDDWIELVTP
jgi:hypothetical protein